MRNRIVLIELPAARNLAAKESPMKTSIAVLTLALATAAAAPAFASDALARTIHQSLKLKDGSTLYIFEDGRMGREDRYGRAAYLMQGEVLELADGRKVTAVGNEIVRLHGLLTDGHGS